MKQKAPNCLHGHVKMRKTYCLVTSAGKKRWPAVGWTCPVCGMLEIDKKDFPEMGHGRPGAPMCPSCKKTMKALYSQIVGKNQMKRLKGMFVCLSQTHPVESIPRELIDDNRIVLQVLRKVIVEDERYFYYQMSEEKHGKEYTDQIRELDSRRTIHDKMMASYNISGKRGHVGKIVYSDGSAGDFVFWPEAWTYLRKLKEDQPWDAIREGLEEIGIKMNREDGEIKDETYINTAFLVSWLSDPVSEVNHALWPSLRQEITFSYIFSNAYVLYGFLLAYSYFQDTLNEDLDADRKEAAGDLFMKLLNSGLDIRAISHKMFWLDFWAGHMFREPR